MGEELVGQDELVAEYTEKMKGEMYELGREDERKHLCNLLKTIETLEDIRFLREAYKPE